MIILGTNSIKDTGYNVANSCRFNDGDSAFLSKTLGTGTNTTKLTVSVWIKRGALGTEQQIFETWNDNNNRFDILFKSSTDQLEIQNTLSGSTTINLKTNRVFRDPSAWMNIVVIVDSTQSTASNRVKLYINGTQETSFATETYLNEDANLALGTSSYTNFIGKYSSSGGNFFDGYMCEVVYLDGTAASIGDLGEFDEDSPTIWKPKDVSELTFGNNGAYLDFEDSSNLGNDANGGTDYGETNLAATDQTTDTCTNNFATLNPLNVPTSNAPTFAEGNIKTTTTASGYFGGSSTIGVSSGKWYFEFKTATDPNTQNVLFGVSYNPAEDARNNYHIGQSPTDWNYGYNLANGEVYHDNNDGVAYGNSLTTSNILGMALDLDNHKIYWSKDNTWQNSGDPTSGATGTGAFSLDTGQTYFVILSDLSASGASAVSTNETNFGNPYNSLTSAASDANGYGSFEYAPPSGYYSLCTKNLAEYG